MPAWELQAKDPVVAEPRSTRPWPHELTDTGIHPLLNFGQLENGLRFVWVDCADSRGQVHLWLHVAAGSLVEEDGQHGMAHVIEHMGFNGTKHFESGAIPRWGQRNGLSLGAHLSAFTTQTNTTYGIELPTNDSELVQEALEVLREFAGGMLFLPEEVEAELAVVDAEQRDRTSPYHRVQILRHEWTYAGTRLATHSPIGMHTERSLFRSDDLKEFYKKWYAAPNLTLLMVGHLEGDPSDEIERLFGDLDSGEGGPPSWPKLGKVQLEEAAFGHIVPGLPSASIVIEWIRPWKGAPTRRADLSNQQLVAVSVDALKRKLSKNIESESSSLLSVEASSLIGEVGEPIQGIRIELNAAPDQWESALALTRRELESAISDGFSAGELASAIQNSKETLEFFNERSNWSFSEHLVPHLLRMADGYANFPDPETVLAELLDQLSTTDAEDYGSALAIELKKGNLRISISGPSRIGDDLETRAFEAWKAETFDSRVKTKLDQSKAFHYATKGAVVVDPDSDPDHASNPTQLWFEELDNGVRLAGIETRGDQVLVRAVIGDGLRSLKPSRRFVARLTETLLPRMGLRAHSFIQWQELLADRVVHLGFEVKNYALIYEGNCDRNEVLLQCELIAAHIADPGWDPEVLRKMKETFDVESEANRQDPRSPIERDFLPELYKENPLRLVPTRAEVEQLEVETVRAWVEPQLTRGPLTVVFWGNISRAAAIAYAKATFGAMESRASHGTERAVPPLVPQSGLVREYSIETDVPYGLIQVIWPGPDAIDNLARKWEQTLLARVLQNRMRARIREELGLSYAPSTAAYASLSVPGDAFIVAGAKCDPNEIDRVLETILAIGDELVRDGVGAEEVNRAKQPILNQLTAEEPIERLSRLHTRPDALDEYRREKFFFREAAPHNLPPRVRKQLARERASIAIVRPTD